MFFILTKIDIKVNNSHTKIDLIVNNSLRIDPLLHQISLLCTLS